ncbi:MAG: hypothetical protein KC503_41405 [Myxococcales bacterium]|nr:hypothetical protein [Myxococcales bacterium]
MKSALLLLATLTLLACGGRAVDDEEQGKDPVDQTQPRPREDQSGVYIITDASAYKLMGEVVATIVNGTSEAIWVEGCSAFWLLHFERGGWAEIGPASHCGFASVPRRIAPGARFSETFNLNELGGWFIRSRYATACGTAPSDITGALDTTGKGDFTGDLTRCAVRYARSPELEVVPSLTR